MILLIYIFSIPELVQQFIRVYDVDFNVGQTRDAGALADSWVNCQQVHPDQPPELGKGPNYLLRYHMESSIVAGIKPEFFLKKKHRFGYIVT